MERCIVNGDCAVIDDNDDEDEDEDEQWSSSSSCHIRCGEDLVVSDDEDCDKLRESGWKTITVNHACVNFTEDWVISEEYSCLQKLVVMKSTLTKLKSLTISSMIILK